MNDQDYYSTTDIYISATLLTLGHNLADIQLVDGARNKVGLFLFDNETNPAHDVERYTKEDPSFVVLPKRVFLSMKNLKHRLFEKIDQGIDK